MYYVSGSDDVLYAANDSDLAESFSKLITNAKVVQMGEELDFVTLDFGGEIVDGMVLSEFDVDVKGELFTFKFFAHHYTTLLTELKHALEVSDGEFVVLHTSLYNYITTVKIARELEESMRVHWDICLDAERNNLQLLEPGQTAAPSSVN